jgi:hypothetical protein
MSFFMLLVVALGLSVVRESLGVTMRKCQALAVAHFIFGSEFCCISDSHTSLTMPSSSLCYRNRRIGAGVDLRPHPSFVHYTSCFYSQCLHVMDHAFLEWCVELLDDRKVSDLRE